MLVDMRTNSFYSLIENKVVSLGGGDIGGDGGDSIRIVGSSHGWLAFLTEECLDLFLWNPVLGRRVDLPSIHNLDLSVYGLESLYGCVQKLTVSSASPDDADCRAVLSYGTYRLAFCCPGRSGAEWISIGARYFDNDQCGRFYREYADFVFSTRQNRLYCITKDSDFFVSDLERWDLEDPFSPRIDGSNSKEPELEESESELDEPESEDERSNSEEPQLDESELEESESELDELERDDERSSSLVLADDDQVFIVVRKIGTLYTKNRSDLIHKTIDFDVYKVCEGEDGQLTTPHVESLDGLSMFVGINECFALSAAQFPELKPNSIYFTNPTDWHPDTLTWWRSRYGIGRYDIGIFDYQNEIFYSCYSRLQHIEEASLEEGGEASPPKGGGEEDEEEEGDEDGIIYELLPLIVWFRPNYVASEF